MPKIIQITATSEGSDGERSANVYALCEDGSVWQYCSWYLSIEERVGENVDKCFVQEWRKLPSLPNKAN